MGVVSTIADVRLSATKLIPKGASHDPNWVAKIVPSMVLLSRATALQRKMRLAVRLANRCGFDARQNSVVRTRPTKGAAIGRVRRTCADIIPLLRSDRHLYSDSSA